MDANLQDLFAVQKGMKLVVREVREEFGVCLFAAGNRSTLKEFSRPCVPEDSDVPTNIG